MGTVSEILAYDGVWSPDLISLFLPVAVEIETRREQAANRAAEAAIASLFSKGDVGKNYKDSLEKVLELVRADQLEGREAVVDRHATAAQKLLDAVSKVHGIERR